MFLSINHNMRRVFECLEPLDSVRWVADGKEESADSATDLPQLEALWSNASGALKWLHGSALTMLIRRSQRELGENSKAADQCVDAVDHQVFRGEGGQIVIRDIVVLLSGVKIRAATVV